MLRHVVRCVVPDNSKNCSDIIFSYRKLLFVLSIMTLRPFALSGTIYITTQGNIPEDLNL